MVISYCGEKIPRRRVLRIRRRCHFHSENIGFFTVPALRRKALSQNIGAKCTRFSGRLAIMHL